MRSTWSRRAGAPTAHEQRQWPRQQLRRARHGRLLLLAAGGLAACSGLHRHPVARPEAIFGRATDAPAVRAAALVARLTLDEKVRQLETGAPAIPRLGIPAYDWWSESLHGVARAGAATVFPQVIGLAATFDEELVRRVAAAIAAEGRAKFDARHGAEDGSGRYGGLTFFAPNINIFRDPRWGRGQETFGEDPFLTARLAVAYVRGLQGDEPRRLQAAAVAKHFAAHSGPESLRHGFDARVNAHDLADTYLPQFEAVVREGRVAGIMAAYNRLNGEPCVTNRALLDDRLRRQWGFEGFVVGDCGAVEDVYQHHRTVEGAAAAAAAALRAGTDLDCGSTFRHLREAVRSGELAESEVDRALVRLFAVRFRLGLFDSPRPPESVAEEPQSQSQSRPQRLAAGGSGAIEEDHRALAREAAVKSIVLLRNTGVLPLRASVRRLAVVGPTADNLDVLVGNYHGTPRAPVTLRAGLEAAAQRRGIEVRFSAGVELSRPRAPDLAAAVELAGASDVVVACLGLSPRLESEEGDPDSGNPAGDRRDLGLPGMQTELLRRLLATGKPVVVVLTGGSALTLPEGLLPDAVVMVWYPGEAGGDATADVLFGAASPSGRLPITFYRDIRQLPPFADYAMHGRTYRYFAGEVAYPFGHGLTYAPGGERDATAAWTAESASVRLEVSVDNPGPVAVERTVPVFAERVGRAAGEPLRALIAFRRVRLPPASVTPIELDLPAASFRRVDEAGQRHLAPGVWRLHVGAAAPVDVRIPGAGG